MYIMYVCTSGQCDDTDDDANDKGKVKLFLCLTKHHAVKAYGGMEVWLHVFLTSALDGDEWSASRPSRFTPGKEPPVPIA